MISAGKINKKDPVKLFVLNLPVLLPLLSLAFSTNFDESARIFIKTTPIVFFSIFAIYMNSWFKNKIEIAFKFLVLGTVRITFANSPQKKCSLIDCYVL